MSYNHHHRHGLSNPPSYQSFGTESTLSPTTICSTLEGETESSVTASEQTYRRNVSPHPYADRQQNMSTSQWAREQEDEHEPLLPGAPNPTPRTRRSNRMISSRAVICVLIFVIFVIASTWGIDNRTNTDRPEVRNRIRAEWAREVQQHNLEKAGWDKERCAYEVMKVEWGDAVNKHNVWVQEARKERRKWTVELRTHMELRESMDKERHQWESELRNYTQKRREMNHNIAKWRRKDQKRMEEEEERHKAGLFWAQLGVGKCEGYNTRRYWSTLQHIPGDFQGDRITACMETPARVHGREVKPFWCDDLGEQGVWGNWAVDFDEPGCTPRWNEYKDNGCTAPGSGLREIEFHLEHIFPYDAYDWRDICIHTPASFGGRNYSSPDYCENWGSDLQPNIFGYWRVDDVGC